MKMRMLGKNRKIIFLLFLLCSFSLQAQIDTRGTDFWLGIMGRTSGGGDVSIRVVSGNQAAMGSIYFTHLGTSVPFFIPANSVFTHDLNSSQKQAIQSVSTGTTDYSVHITSSTLVTVYCLSAAGNAACDATNVLPVTALGTDYYQMNYTQASPSNYTSDYLVVAVQNNTQVFHNGSLAATLGTGGVYYRKNTSDNTGTHITTSKPAAFIAATGGAYIPLGSAAIDNMLQQLAPVNTWGKNFFIPVTVRKRERIRVVASQNGTNITQTGGVIQSVAGGQTSLNNLNAGQWVELEISLANNGCYLQANKPVGVCSYLTGGTYNRPLTNNDDSDPAQAWVPSIEQSVDTALIAPFMPNGATNLSAHYAMVITPTATKNLTRVSVGGAASVALNGGQWYDNATAGMSFYMMPLSNNPAISYMFTNATGGLIVMGYGIGNAVSYYYLASAGMRSLDIAFYVKNIYYQNINSPFICANSLPFRAEINGDRSPHAGYLKWYIDGVEEVNARDSITWNKTLPNGTYQIRMTVLAFDNITVDTVETTISIQSADTAALYDTVCQHFAYSNHGFTISANQLQTAGNFEFRDTVLSTEGCDSVIVLHLKVNQLDTTMLYDTICLNNAYSNYGFAISANQLQTAGNFEFRDTVLNTNGCDSLIILYLKVNRLDTTMLYDTICLNNAYSNYGFSIPANQLITAGNFEFRDTTLNIGGCDSLVILYLTVNQYDTTVLYDTVCLHHAYSNHGFDISANQLPTVGDFEFRDTVQNIVGCDSLIILHLTVKHADIAIFYDTTCLHHAYSNYGFDIPANQLITAGNLEFRDTVQNMAGCDSTIVLYLTVNQIDTTIFYDTICLNNPYSNYGFTIPANQLQTAGNFEFRDTVLNTGGCDSIIVLYLTVNQIDTTIFYDTICLNNPYSNYGFDIPANQLQTAGNFEFRDTVLNTGGCDSIIVLYLTVNQINTTTFYDTICLNNPYSNYGFDIPANQLQTAGNFEFRDTILNTAGCDSIVALHLTVNQIDTTILYDTVCLHHAYVNHGFTIPANQLQTAGSFEFRDTVLNTAACDSIIILYLTVNHLDTTILYDTVCFNNAYSNYGFTISANQLQTAGNFEFRDTVLNTGGCDSIIVLYLTVNQIDTTTFYDTICLNNPYSNYGFDIPANQLQTAGNFEFRDTILNTDGCDSIIVLYLTVNQSDIAIFYDTICPNNTYAKHGFYIPANELQTEGTFEFRDTISTTTFCDNFTILNLTVTYSYSITMPDNKYFCAGETCPAIDFSGTNIDALEWEITSNSGEAIGLFAENGTGTIPAFTTVNYSDTAVTVEITVTPKSTEGCSGTPQIFTITVYSSNPLHINLGNDTTICWLDSLKLDAKNTEATHYQWQDASTGNTYTVYYDGQYWVKITNLCSGASDTINISYLKAINLDLGSDTVFCENDRIHLEFDVSSPHASYLWQDGSISPVYIAEKAGIYSVTVSNVCMSVSGEMEISLKNCDSLLIWTPNAFTPNGDGLNDVFKPMIYREELLKRFEMFIYDRWGNLIFTTQDYLIGWDGGNYAEGVYSCHIRLTDIEDKVIVRYTSILLTR